MRIIAMKIDIPPEVIEDLRQILQVLEDTSKIHSELGDSEELIEPWTPSDSDSQINCPDLTVGLIRKAEKVKKLLRL
jgi:hypothetical protein